AVDVVHVPIVVVIDTIPRNLSRVGVNVSRDVRMGKIDSGVDHRNYHVGAANRYVPGLIRLYVGVGSSVVIRIALVERVAGVEKRPLLPEVRIIGNDAPERYQIVRLGVFDVVAHSKLADYLPNISILVELNNEHAIQSAIGDYFTDTRTGFC